MSCYSSHFKILYASFNRIAIDDQTLNGDSPYEELSSAELAEMTGYKKSLFEEVGRTSIALALFDGWFGTNYISDLIKELPAGKFTLKSQRAFSKSARDCLKENVETFKKAPFYEDLSQWVFPSAFWKGYSKIIANECVNPMNLIENVIRFYKFRDQ